ncbi:MAG: hypothetical protein IPM42_11160 [Saprospiraceae bacterium]|nr:hypothetical protein [Saprospiraceae bacterium]
MRKVLHIVGSLNQTRQLYKISQSLPDFEHYYTQYFGSGKVFKWIAESGIADFTIMGTNSAFRMDQKEFLESVQAKYDYRGTTLGNTYDLVFICGDMIVPKEIRYSKIIFIQEGMTDPVSWRSRFFNKLGVPAWMTGDTSLNGCSNTCDIYCVASVGYGRFFSSMGTDSKKIVVTGIPNFDDAVSFLDNDLDIRNYVLVCTSDMREVGKKDNRIDFLKRCKKLAAGRDIVFKLHPNEKPERAESEIKSIFGENVTIYKKANTDHLIANCDELITQYSSVVYIGMALGKKVHSYFSMKELMERLPVQNGGTSAHKIASIGREFVDFKGSGIEFLQSLKPIEYFQNQEFSLSYE